MNLLIEVGTLSRDAGAGECQQESASAICMSEEVSGDNILLIGRKYIVCAPTFIGAPLSASMPKMDNNTAKVILLP